MNIIVLYGRVKQNEPLGHCFFSHLWGDVAGFPVKRHTQLVVSLQHVGQPPWGRLKALVQRVVRFHLRFELFGLVLQVHPRNTTLVPEVLFLPEIQVVNETVFNQRIHSFPKSDILRRLQFTRIILFQPFSKCILFAYSATEPVARHIGPQESSL